MRSLRGNFDVSKVVVNDLPKAQPLPGGQLPPLYWWCNDLLSVLRTQIVESRNYAALHQNQNKQFVCNHNSWSAVSQVRLKLRIPMSCRWSLPISWGGQGDDFGRPPTPDHLWRCSGDVDLSENCIMNFKSASRFTKTSIKTQVYKAMLNEWHYSCELWTVG